MNFSKKKPNARRVNIPENRSAATSSYYRPARNSSVNPVVKATKNVGLAKQPIIAGLNISKLINYLIVACFMGLIFFATTLSADTDIKVTKESFSYRDPVIYKKVSTDILKKNLLGRSKLFFRSSEFEEKMRQEFPEIDKIEAIVPLGGRNLTVAMHLSSPLAIAYSGNQNGILDSAGVLVTASIPDQQDLLKVRFATPQQNFQVGSRILTSNEVEQLNLLSYELSMMPLGIDKKPLEIAEALFSIDDGQIEVKLKNKPYFLKLSTYSDAREQVGAVKAILQKLDREGLTPTNYVDVRVPGRVFVV